MPSHVPLSSAPSGRPAPGPHPWCPPVSSQRPKWLLAPSCALESPVGDSAVTVTAGGCSRDTRGHWGGLARLKAQAAQAGRGTERKGPGPPWGAGLDAPTVSEALPAPASVSSSGTGELGLPVTGLSRDLGGSSEGPALPQGPQPRSPEAPPGDPPAAGQDPPLHPRPRERPEPGGLRADLRAGVTRTGRDPGACSRDRGATEAVCVPPGLWLGSALSSPGSRLGHLQSWVSPCDCGGFRSCPDDHCSGWPFLRVWGTQCRWGVGCRSWGASLV